MDKFYWNLTVIDGKEYIVETNYSDINRFLKMVFRTNAITTFTLRESIVKNNLSMNTIAIPSSHITSVQYSYEVEGV